MNDLLDIETYLTTTQSRVPGGAEDAAVEPMLKQLKQEAIAINDQARAKQIWCLETIYRLQNNYVSAFRLMKEGKFYSAWCVLEQVELDLGFLEPHFELNTGGRDSFSLCFIKKHNQQFQFLFPYRHFVSPAFLIHKAACSICGKPISIRHPCGHVIGEIYNGEQCAREILAFDVLEISDVENPVQKYSVSFLSDSKTGEAIDHYNYFHVDYVIRGLRNPWVGWEQERTTIDRPRSDFKNVGRNDSCPCGSNKKFKHCCLRKPLITCKHMNVRFSEPPPPGFSEYEADGYVRSVEAPIYSI